jgi:hypothetical protein
MRLMLGDGDDEDNDDEWLTKGDCNGNTALHYAYAFGHAQISNMLEAKVEDYSVRLSADLLAISGQERDAYIMNTLLFTEIFSRTVVSNRTFKMTLSSSRWT